MDKATNIPGNDYAPTASWTMLRERAKLIAELRQFFVDRDFLEVETPLISRDTVIDRYLDPIEVSDPIHRQQTKEGPFWLQTSPEFAMKRMLCGNQMDAAGAPVGIFQICKAFRREELGNFHNPEFTMLEWYRIGDDYQTGRRLLGELASYVLSKEATKASFSESTYRDAFLDLAKIDPFQASENELKECADLEGSELSGDRDFWLNIILESKVQPELGKNQPVVLYDYPASQAALATTRKKDGVLLAERFELFYQGVELANGYHELSDPDVLLKRNLEVNELRRMDGSQTFNVESRLLQGLRSGFPACSGTALGVDRLLMCRLESDHINDVITFPFDRA